MATYVVDDDVVKLLSVKGLTAEALEPYSAIADLLVMEELADVGMSDSRLTKIGNLLTAHYYTVAVDRGGLMRKEIGQSSESYRTTTRYDHGIIATHYGQQAAALDISGKLSGMGNLRNRAEFRVL